jgi:hypothetical protein
MSNSWWDRQFSKTIVPAPRQKVAQWQQPVPRETPQFRTSVPQQRETFSPEPETFDEALHDPNYKPKKQPDSVKQGVGNCPDCGGQNYFAPKAGGRMTQNGLATPAPHCFDCGFNGGTGDGASGYHHENIPAQDDGRVIRARGSATQRSYFGKIN